MYVCCLHLNRSSVCLSRFASACSLRFVQEKFCNTSTSWYQQHVFDFEAYNDSTWWCLTMEIATKNLYASWIDYCFSWLPYNIQFSPCSCLRAPCASLAINWWNSPPASVCPEPANHVASWLISTNEWVLLSTTDAMNHPVFAVLSTRPEVSCLVPEMLY